MGYQWKGAVRALRGSDPTPLLPLLAVLAAALMIHLFGPALQARTGADSAASGHGHATMEASTHPVGTEVAGPAAANNEETCHSLVGVASTTTAVPAITCSVTTWRPDHSTANAWNGLRNSWIGGDGADALADPRRSPGVQRT